MKNHNGESRSGLVTCVRLSKETRDRLAQLGSKDQTFDDIINVMIDGKHQDEPQEVTNVRVSNLGENKDDS